MSLNDSQTKPAAQLQGDVAIVGMGCLFAGASGVDQYWQNILSKVDAVGDPPAGEWDPAIFYDPSAKSNDRVYCKRGGYIGDRTEFRPEDFGIMPITVDGGEPDQWLALRVTQEALTDAGYIQPPKENVRTEVILGKGTYVNRGNLTVGYHGMIVEFFLQTLKNLHPESTDEEIERVKKELKANLPPFNADTAPALIGNIIAGRIANRLDLMGPAFTVDAACASALLAIEIGIRDLLSGKCDLVLAGGSNVNAPLPTMSLFCQLGALSRSERIRPFDKDADGTILGEGVGMIVLKRREDAERDGSRIYAIVKGVGMASDGRATHVLAPRVEGEELALRRAYEMAGVSPESVGLIEAHGTATPVGDAVEVQALSRVFGERKGMLPSCAIGSVKSMIGHAMPAAGIAGVIKAALSLHHRVLPPTLNCDEPSPALHLDKTPFYVNTEARPWIHSSAEPRRAGVNSFGFGGINGHVVLEEYETEDLDARSHYLHWETEVCIIEGDSREELAARGRKLEKFLESAEEIPLKDIAYSLNSSLEGRGARLAIVAESRFDLTQKLELALSRIADPKSRQIKDNRGIYFFDEPFEGKLAFLFPGEGAQYPNMLLDLCLHFPEVRRCFDLADKVLSRGDRPMLPSEYIFPRSILSKSEKESVNSALWQIEGAVEGVLIGNWAIWTLLNRLQIQPDVIMGQSTGDLTAMRASGIINLSNEEYLEAMFEGHGTVNDEVSVPKAKLVAVAADAAAARSIAAAVSGEIHIAMDNCPHQVVLAGAEAAIDEAVKVLRTRGMIYEVLPFDRPYHTPLFRPYAERLEAEFLIRFQLSAPNITTYSCTTAAPYPTDLDEIRKLYLEHWVGPVRVTETIERMYDDGVRIFVESGPRGNLTSFVSDILRGKPHLAMPANVPRRSGVTQLNHLAGILAAQRVNMDLDYLYARRDCRKLAWDADQLAAPARRKPPMKLALALPPLKVAPREAVSKSQRETFEAPSRPQSKPFDSAPLHEDRVRLSDPRPAVVDRPAEAWNVPQRPAASFADGQTRRPQAAPPTARAPLPAMGGGSFAPTPTSAGAMQQYLSGMEAFLDVETEVMSAYLRSAAVATADVDAAPAPPAPPSSESYPLLGSVLSHTSGEELTAVRRLSREEDIFLADHALGGPVSVTDPSLKPLVVTPLTMSMEMLAEAAAALMPGRVLVGMRDVRAQQWIRVDDRPVDLQISARRVEGSSDEIFVQISDVSLDSETQNSKLLLQGTVTFADHYPASETPSAASLTGETVSSLASADLYDGRLMFHGPVFQGVARVETCAEDGCVGRLRVLPTDNLFRSIPNPRFTLDPVVLDAAGQLVGFWTAERLERGFVVFPYQLDSLRVFGPNRRPGEELSCRVKVERLSDHDMRSNIEIVGADGSLWMSLKGWADRRFDPPKRFHHAWIAPHEATISDAWQAPLATVPPQVALECRRVEPLFDSATAFWADLWATLILNRRERAAFTSLRGPERRRMEWLSGRTAAKDAVCAFLHKRYGWDVLPADIEIGQDERGKPFVAGPWAEQLPSLPEISISHSETVAAAVAGEEGSGLGIDIQKIRELEPGFSAVALGPDEQQLLDSLPASLQAEWLLRIWCAKEAVAKALGVGLIEGPSSVKVVHLDTISGLVRAIPQGQLANEAPEAAGRELPAYTSREKTYITAIAVFDRNNS